MSGFIVKLQVSVGKSKVSSIRSKVSVYLLFYLACLSQAATFMRNSIAAGLSIIWVLKKRHLSVTVTHTDKNMFI